MDNKIKVLIASVLKPADDVRSCFKIGQSLAQTNKYEVNIIGFDSKKKVQSENIFLYPIFKFKRNSIKRLFAPFSILKFYLKLKPQFIIVNTPELLWVMFFIRILFGTKIVYDIQENYRSNVKTGQIYKGLTKTVIDLYIQITENLSTNFVDGYFLAEEVYEKQLSFIHKRPYIKLLNKSIVPIKQKIEPKKYSNHDFINFIYSGTIGKEYGTLEAIDFCKKLHEFNPNMALTIIGYSSDNEYLKSVKLAISNIDYIQLKTDNKPIPQSKIIAEIKNSDIALLPYQLNPNISGRFPTKIYDYLVLGVPMVIPPHVNWKHYLDQYKANISVDFTKIDIRDFMQKLNSATFYNNVVNDEIQWKNQEPILLEFIQKILSK